VKSLVAGWIGFIGPMQTERTPREGVMSPHGADFCPKLTDALREADKPFWQP
jgi:hypothetical protein